MDHLTTEQQEIVLENIGLAHSVADRMLRSNLPPSDRRQSGVAGLIDAVRSHDPEKSPLSLHAKKYIKRAILEADARNRAIYVPVRVFQSRQANGSDRQKKTLEAAVKSRRVNALSDVDHDRSSSKFDPSLVVERDEWLDLLRADIRELVSCLKPKQKEAVDGFLSGEEQKDTAERLGYTRQNISALKKSAFKKMKKRLSKYVA